MIPELVIPEFVVPVLVAPVPCHPEVSGAQDPVPVVIPVELLFCETAELSNLTTQLTVLD